jgi:hypothetical protein
LENVVCYENHANDSRITESKEVSPLISSRAGTGGNNLPLVQKCFVKTSKPRFKGDCETYVDTGVAPTVNCFDQGDKRANELICESMPRGDSPLIQECYAFEPGIAKREGGDSRFVEECSGTLRSNAGDNQTAVAIAENIIGRQVQNGGNGTGAQEEIAYTQNTSGVMGVAHKATVRRFLPVECERLMGFPDNWTRIPWKGKPEEDCPDSPRYKACGNSMCVNVMRWIGMRIEMVERRMKGGEDE